jgi:DNA-binding transcriptional ArsR family regulator
VTAAAAPSSISVRGSRRTSRTAVDRHLRVLLEAGLVTKGKTGRTTAVRLVPGSLEELAVWAMSTRLMWGNALDRLERHLTTSASKEES